MQELPTLNMTADDFDALVNEIDIEGLSDEEALEEIETVMTDETNLMQILPSEELNLLWQKILEWIKFWKQAQQKVNEWLSQTFIEIRGNQMYFYLPKIVPPTPGND